MIFNTAVSAPRFPIFSYIVGGNTYRFDGTSIDTDGIKATLAEDCVKLWFKQSGTLRFDLLIKPVDICAIGKGGTSGTGHGAGGSGAWQASGGGGSGGEIVNSLNTAMAMNTDYAVTVGNTNSVIGNDVSITAQNGNDGQRGYAASDIHMGEGGIVPNSNPQRKGATGVCRNGASHYKDNIPASDGLYAFNDASFDGIKYAPCGGSGNAGSVSGNTKGADSTAAGAGGTSAGVGGGTYYSAVEGNPGIVLMRIPLL